MRELVIATPRLRLSTWRLADAEAAHAIWGDPRVMRWVGPPHADVGRTRAALRAAMDAQREHGVCLWRVAAADGAVVGACGFQIYEGPGSRRPGSRWLELAYHFRADCWGRGYASEAARAAVAHAWTLGATTLVAMTHLDNVASARVLAKLGFARDGEAGGEWRHRLECPHMTDELDPALQEMIADGKLSRAELKRFEADLLADGQLSVRERRMIDRVLEMIQRGEIELVD